MPDRARVIRLLTGLVSFVLTLIFLEAVLQLIDKPAPVISGWRSDRVGIAEAEMNQLGFRGQPIQYSAQDYVIVLLGDSQVEADACPANQMPEKRLQYHLGSRYPNLKVFTLGASGYGQDQELLALRDYYQRYRADLVLLWESPENDIWNNVFPMHWPANGTPKPTFWLERDQLRGPTEEIGQSILPWSKLAALCQIALFPSRDEKWERYLPQPYVPLDSYNGPVSDLWQIRFDRNLGRMRHENLKTEKSHLAVFLKPRSPRMLYGLDLTSRLLAEIEKEVSEHGGKFVTFRRDYPSSWTVNRSPSGEQVYVLNGKYYRTSNAQFLENILYMNRAVKHYFVPVTVEGWKAAPEDPHLNRNAVDQVMKDLASSIEELIPAR